LRRRGGRSGRREGCGRGRVACDSGRRCRAGRSLRRLLDGCASLVDSREASAEAERERDGVALGQAPGEEESRG
jgi:hypothetical protein